MDKARWITRALLRKFSGIQVLKIYNLLSWTDLKHIPSDWIWRFPISWCSYHKAKRIITSFLLSAVMLAGTGGPNLLIHGSVAGVTKTALGFLTMGWPTQHQTCWNQMRFTFLKGVRGSLLRSLWDSLTGI